VAPGFGDDGVEWDGQGEGKDGVVEFVAGFVFCFVRGNKGWVGCIGGGRWSTSRGYKISLSVASFCHDAAAALEPSAEIERARYS
jgi:hypothetical protein